MNADVSVMQMQLELNYRFFAGAQSWVNGIKFGKNYWQGVSPETSFPVPTLSLTLFHVGIAVKKKFKSQYPKLWFHIKKSFSFEKCPFAVGLSYLRRARNLELIEMKVSTNQMSVCIFTIARKTSLFSWFTVKIYEYYIL